MVLYSTFAYGDASDPLKMYRGKDCVEKFVECIEEEVRRLYETFSRQPMTRLTNESKLEHEAAEKCHICLKEFNDPRNRKVRDHPHCISQPEWLSRPLVYQGTRRFNKNDIGVIAENKEKYISFNAKLAEVKYEDGAQVHKNIRFRFIDSCRFMASSLDKLASNLCGTSGIQCDKCKGNMELIHISGDYIASLGCEGC